MLLLYLHLLVGILSGLSSLYASLVVLRVPPFSLLLLRLFIVIVDDLILISRIVRVLGILVGLLQSGIPCVALKLFDCLFDLDLGWLIVVLQRLAEGVRNLSINVDIEVVKLIFAEV